MIQLLINFCFYLGLAALPFFLYGAIRKPKRSAGNCKTFYAKRASWSYLIKYIVALIKLRKKFKKPNGAEETTGSSDWATSRTAEKIINLTSNKEQDSQVLCGIDSKGNSLYIKITKYFNSLAELSIALTLGGTRYSLPDSERNSLSHTKPNVWALRGLHVEVLEPFRKLRITFNGILKRESPSGSALTHTKFNFIFTSVGSLKWYPKNASITLLARALASEKWRDGNWMQKLGERKSYEQFGVMQGFLQCKEELKELYFNSHRKRCWGEKDISSYQRITNIFTVAEDGTMISIDVRELVNGCKRIEYGNVINKKREVFTIDQIDCPSDLLSGSIPKVFILSITAKKQSHKCVFYTNPKNIKKTTYDSYDTLQAVSQTIVNLQDGKSMLHIWSKKPSRMNEQRKPQPLLTPVYSYDTTKNAPLTLELKSEQSKILQLTGGKGSSLALLANVPSDLFAVPGGFIITTQAFEVQINANSLLQTTLEQLSEASGRNDQDSIKIHCDSLRKIIEEDTMKRDLRDEIEMHLRNFESKLGSSLFAVRSSAVGEDSEDFSSAGQNSTILGCKGEEKILDAIRSCWASLYSYHSVSYRREHGLPVITQMAVVVQELIPAESAGVIFTCNPTNGDPSEMVITANYGLGESVVSSMSEPDTITLSRDSKNNITVEQAELGYKEKIVSLHNGVVKIKDTDKDKRSSLSMTEEDAIRLGSVAHNLEGLFGHPCDIEWAFYQNTLYILQCRPVTALNSWTDFELLHELDSPITSEELSVLTMANTGEVFPDALTPLSDTTVRLVTCRALTRHSTGFNNNYQEAIPSIRHRIMLDVVRSIHKNPRQELDLSSKIIELAVFGHSVLEDGVHVRSLEFHDGPTSPISLLKEFLRMGSFALRTRKLLKEMEVKAKKPSYLEELKGDLEESYEKIDRYVKGELERVAELHCIISGSCVFYQVVALNILAEGGQDFTMEHYNDISLLLSTSELVESANVPQLVNQIVESITEEGVIEEFAALPQEKGEEFLETTTSKTYNLFKRFMTDHGHRLIGEMELQNETWGMNPTNVISMIQQSCRNWKKNETKNLTVDEVLAKLTSPKKSHTRKLLKWILGRARNAVAARERAKSLWIFAVNNLRTSYNILTEKLVKSGYLPHRELVFYLTHQEVKQLVVNKGAPSLVDKARLRQRLFSSWKKQRFPEIMFGYPRPLPEEEEEEEKESLKKSRTVMMAKGTPACFGDVIIARSCVCAHISEISHQLRPGDILIAYSTDIGWSPYFPSLAGIVTELGGLVSHGAVVAREYGLPCIVGVKNATKIFTTGDIVKLSSTTGTVEILA